MHQLYQSRISGWALLVLVLAAAVTIVVAVVTSPAGPILGDYFSASWRTFSYWFTGLFSLIDFRYHLVSIVAVFLALAIGIVLGSTELQGAALSGLRATRNSLRSQLTAAQRRSGTPTRRKLGRPAFARQRIGLLGSGTCSRADRLVLVTEPGARAALSAVTPPPPRRGRDHHRDDRAAEQVQQHQQDHRGHPDQHRRNSSPPATASRSRRRVPADRGPAGGAQLIAAAVLRKPESQGAQNQRSQQNRRASGLSAASAQPCSTPTQQGGVTVTGSPTTGPASCRHRARHRPGGWQRRSRQPGARRDRPGIRRRGAVTVIAGAATP